MKRKIQLITSGISLVDNAWGGFYSGGTYLLIGARKSGRTLLGLQYAMECASKKEVCLYFTSMRPKDLMIQAASIDFDLQDYMNQNLIIVVRVAPPTDLREVSNYDEFLVEYLRDIVTVVEQYQPNRIVFDEITPFVGFNNVNLLQDTFVSTTEAIENAGITSLFVLGEPATPAAQQIVDSLIAYSTGVVFLKKADDEQGGFHGGEMVITPNIGHTEGQFRAKYTIEPYKGVVTESIPVKVYHSKTDERQDTEAKDEKKLSDKYHSFADLSLPEETLSFSNLYSIDDFKLILNNQIALFKSTGQPLTAISFKLDSQAETEKILTLNQLKNAVRLSTDRKDKVCVIGNKVIVLIKKEDKKSIDCLLAKVKSNLPNGDPESHSKVIPFISVFMVKIDNSIENSDDLLNRLEEDEVEEQNNLDFQ